MGSPALTVTETAYSSTANSSTAPLGIGGTFTGEWELNGQPDLMIFCLTDQVATLTIQLSVDGETVESTLAFNVLANTVSFHTLVKGPRYYRCVLQNTSGSPQTSLALQSAFGMFRQPSAPLNKSVALDSDSILVRPTYTWMDISRGLMTGISVVKKFGRNSAIGTSYTPITASSQYQTPTSPVSLEFVSNAAGDALNGVGMHQLTIIGLDANWAEQTVVMAAHATNGTTPVAITGTWLRVYRAFVSSSGTYGTSAAGSHVGTITIRVAGAGATWANIVLDNSFPLGQTLIGAYTVPIGYTGYVFFNRLAINTGKTVSVAFFQRQLANDVTTPYSAIRVQSLAVGLTGGSIFTESGSLAPFGPYVGPADIGFMAAGASTPDVSVEFDVFLVANY